MTRALVLEDFGLPGSPDTNAFAGPAVLDEIPDAAPPSAPQMAHSELDGDGLDAFEQGYRNGWDDCIANETEERRRIGSDLAATLSEMSLAAESMQREILSGLAPLLEQIAEQLLPPLAAEALAPAVMEQVRSIVAECGSVEIELLAAPEKCRPIEAVLQASTDLAVRVLPEPAFAEGQVSIRIADQRRDIDLSDAAERMADIIRAFAAEARSGGVSAAPASPDLQRGVA
jgi:flagellar biosynthesis/type III secretory pathway protein FliH